MDVMSALDAEFLHAEDEVTPLHIGGVATFPGPPPSYDDFVQCLDDRLHRIPRYRQRVETVPFELGRPIWVDHEHFSCRYHVRHTALPAPGDADALDRLVARLMEQRLDRSRPLWEIWMVEGLSEDRWALVFKVHHCMVDGVAGVGLLAAVLDLEPHPEPVAPEPWTPEPAPSVAARIAQAWLGAVEDVTELAGELPAALRHPGDAARAAVASARALLGFGHHIAPTPHSSLDGPIGPHRAYAYATISIADIKAVRTELGGTLNDVVLACVTKGFRDLLEAHGDDPSTAVVRTGVPVSVRREDGQGVADNRVSIMLVELPVHLDDPVERLAAVRAAMEEAKASGMAELGEAVTHLADLVPPMVVGTVTRVGARAMHHLPQRSITTVTTNVPGPQFPLYCHGQRMLEYLPYVPIADGARVGVAILSYDGAISFGVTGDLDSVPDVSVVACGAAAALDELLAAARARSQADEEVAP
ncbi:MAG: wax ester/triacylglycerol synthase family O-acyltransferase [Acidimicrobiales bacterium]